METVNIDNLNLSELKDLLKELKLYKNIKKQLWNRSNKLYNKLKKWEKSLVVEYFSSISKDLAFEESRKIFKNIFNLDAEESEITFLENSELKWWIRVYVDDKVVDLSYSKIEKNFF